MHGELAKLGISISQAAVSKYMVRHRTPPSHTWRSFLDNHANDLVSLDFFTLPTATFRVLFVFIVLRHARRRIVHFNVTEHPSAEWTAQQMVDAFPWDTAPRYLVRDRDQTYGAYFDSRVDSLGMEQVLMCWFSVKMTARLDVNATPGVRMSPLAPGIVPECSGASRVKRATRAGFAALDTPSALWYSLLVGERERSGAPGSECSCGHLVTTPLTPRLSCLLQFPVPLRPDLWGLASHEVQRRNVAYRAVQPNPVVIFDESFHQSARLEGLAGRRASYFIVLCQRSIVIVYRSGLTKGTGVLSGARRIDVTMSITRIPL